MSNSSSGGIRSAKTGFIVSAAVPKSAAPKRALPSVATASTPIQLNSIPSIKVFHIDGKAYTYVKHKEVNTGATTAAAAASAGSTVVQTSTPPRGKPTFVFDANKKWTSLRDPMPETINMQGMRGLKNGFIFRLKPTQDLQNIQKITGTCYITESIDAKGKSRLDIGTSGTKSPLTRKIKCEITGDELVPIFEPFKNNREDITLLGSLNYAFTMSKIYTSPEAIISFFEDLMTYLLSLRFLRDPGIFSLDGMDIDIPLQDLEEMGINPHNYRIFMQIRSVVKIKVISYDTDGNLLIDPKKYKKTLEKNVIQTDFWERWSQLFLNSSIIKEKQISICVLEATCDNIIRATKCVKSIRKPEEEERDMFASSSISEGPRRAGRTEPREDEESGPQPTLREILERIRKLEKEVNFLKKQLNR